MLHIIVFILKSTGILLLIILGITLLLMGSVLFAPITYKIRAESRDGVVRVQAVAGWMVRLLSVHYMLDTGQNPVQLLQGRIFGFPVWKPLEPEKEKQKKKKKVGKKRKAKKQADPAESESEPISAVKKDSGTAVAAVPQPEVKEAAQEQPHEKPPRQSILQKLLYAIRRIYGKITAIGKGLFSQAVKLFHMPAKASETIEILTDFWNLEENVKARESIFRELKFLWKHSRPRKADLTLHFGFEDPSWTGQCMGILSILDAWYPGRIFLSPEFEQEIFEGTFYVKGHMMLAVPLLTAFRLWRDKNVMKMYRHFRQ